VAGIHPGVVVEAVEELGLDVVDEGGEVVSGRGLADAARGIAGWSAREMHRRPCRGLAYALGAREKRSRNGFRTLEQ
jgi:hypothetical protein